MGAVGGRDVTRPTHVVALVAAIKCLEPVFPRVRGRHWRLGVGASAFLAMLAGALLTGCASSTTPAVQSPSRPEPQFAPVSVNPTEQLVAEGATLIVSYRCAACHLPTAGPSVGPNFGRFAGHTVTLADGRRAVVDVRFLRRGLVHPDRYVIRGYDPTPMLRAVRHLNLDKDPSRVAALAAFIEQIGPE